MLDREILNWNDGALLDRYEHGKERSGGENRKLPPVQRQVAGVTGCCSVPFWCRHNISGKDVPRQLPRGDVRRVDLHVEALLCLVLHFKHQICDVVAAELGKEELVTKMLSCVLQGLTVRPSNSQVGCEAVGRLSNIGSFVSRTLLRIWCFGVVNSWSHYPWPG